MYHDYQQDYGIDAYFTNNSAPDDHSFNTAIESTENPLLLENFGYSDSRYGQMIPVNYPIYWHKENHTMPQEVFHVNPRQYQRILKRREARARIADKIEPRTRRYKFLSRHIHAQLRSRNVHGKFISSRRKECKPFEQSSNEPNTNSEYVKIREQEEDEEVEKAIEDWEKIGSRK